MDRTGQVRAPSRKRVLTGGGEARAEGRAGQATLSLSEAVPWRTVPFVPTRIPSRLVTVLLAIGGGLVTDTAFPNHGWWPMAFVGVAALYLALRRDESPWAAVIGGVWGVSFFGVHLLWAREATDVVPYVALVILESVFFATLGAVWVWVRRLPAVGTRPAVRAVAFTVLFVATEQLRSQGPFGGFPWGRLAFSQVDAPLGRMAWLGGEVLVSFTTVLIGVLLVVAVERLGSVHSWMLPTGAVAVVVMLLIGPLFLHLDVRAQRGSLAIGAVQGNVSEPGLGSFANRGEVLTNHIDGTLALLDTVDRGELDVVLWPENGSDLDPQEDREVATAIDAAARAVGTPILVGAQEYPASGGRYNVLLLWEPGEGVVGRYAKQHPAPFGEYIPLRSFVRVFSEEVDRVSSDMLAGHQVGVVGLPVERLGRTVPLGTVICFEVAYEPLVRAAVEAGAQMLVVPTNNASFGYTPESTQQLAMSRLRAITTGRATVQISTVGVSAVISPDGSVRERTGLFTADQMVAELPLRTSMTPAVRLGGWPGAIVEAIAGALAVTAIVAGFRRRRAESGSGAATELSGAQEP